MKYQQLNRSAASTLARGLMIVLLASLPAAPQTATYDFEEHPFTVELPPGYQLMDKASPMRGLMIYGFTTNPRNDGTRGLIELTFLDTKSISDPVNPEQFVASMVGGVRRRRNHWKQSETSIELSGMHAKRIEWSGDSPPPPKGAPNLPSTGMRGVMIIGMTDHIGFSLHAEDVASFADQTLPLCEKALKTFKLIVPL